MAPSITTLGRDGQPTRVEHWYGDGARDLRVASAIAVWRRSGVPVVPMRWVLIREPVKPDAPAGALLCTDLDRTPEQIVTWFVRRWRIETTFGEVRTHLGVETQRQWCDRAIARTTPCLLALFAAVTLLAGRLVTSRQRRPLPTPSRPFAVRSGANSMSKHHRGEPIAGKSPSSCRRPGPTRSAMPPEKDSVELSARTTSVHRTTSKLVGRRIQTDGSSVRV